MTTRTAALTRRQALRLLAAAGLWPLGCAPADPRAVGERIAQLRADPGAAVRVGSAWLASKPDPPSLGDLVADLERSAGLPSEARALREALEAAHRRDLVEGRIETLHGYWLSRTEVALYAVLAWVA